MSFLSGKVTALRFQIEGPKPDLFGPEHLERLGIFRAGRQRIASDDGIEVGWSAGGHILDTTFELEKNLVNDALCFELRVDTDKLPADKLKAYIAVEQEAILKGTTQPRLSARQKKETREAATDRLEEEAKDGRFKKSKCVPVLWDRPTNTVLFGATSFTHVDRLCRLFQQTFGYSLTALTAGWPAPRNIESTPAAYIPGVSAEDIAWIIGDTNRDYLGNEFILWLWYYANAVDDTIKLADGSECTWMLARDLRLDCPRGLTGSDTFSHEGPSRLPEAKRAIQSGKLPRKCGLTLVRHGEQYEFALHAEKFIIGSAKLPPMPEDVIESRAMLETRIAQIRDMQETLDHLYAKFLGIRFSTGWSPGVLPKIQGWLQAGAEKKVAA